MSQNRRIAFVIPWYGNTNGGAETLCRNLSRQLADDGRAVEVWTTCSLDPFHRWDENHHAPGASQDGKVTVRRFPVAARDADAYVAAERLFDRAPAGVDAATEQRFFENSVNSPQLRAHALAAGPDTLICFLPYLYGTTVNVLPAVSASPTALIPCLHDESYAYSAAVERAFVCASGVMFLSPAEQRLAATMFDLTQKPHGLLGVGVERDRPGDADAFRRKHGIDGPFLLYCGRKVAGKGVDLLVDHFAFARKDKRLRGLKLVLSGAGEYAGAASADSGVVDLGFLNDHDLAGAMAACEVFCQPSFMESFSIVLMQAWLEGRPALVNGACDVTREHCVACNGGLWFGDRREFAEALAYLIENPPAAAQMGANGRSYVEREYNWRVVLERFNAIAGAIAS